ncbi:AAA family ATPase [Fuerstiella marisgermanici]|uniref:Polynucleotide kinase n=1 Tax=Fuerstiella marisgermanici TaxID=1891926 RepID=A0A1P8W910_9PLAN|nr:AAA family ATPase [Fuerstiella marisgermanici]APZ90552.1 polynucleotide kinase [Fuerstiella marisgermanici]
MEAVVFIGLQASGKSSFFKERFFSTHVRISLDLLRTRNRERRLLAACLETQQPFVIDNTNPTREERAKYIDVAKTAKYSVVGIYFRSKAEECLTRNQQRTGPVPEVGILSTATKLELPTFKEGFDALKYVRLTEDGFVVEEWNDEI